MFREAFGDRLIKKRQLYRQNIKYAFYTFKFHEADSLRA